MSAGTRLPQPLALDEDSVGIPMAAAAPPQLGPTPWISFSGASDDSSAASFVQSVQRIAFTHNRIEDDKWIAQYASTCFTDAALVWYLSLEKETRSSWEHLRLALVQRYPPVPAPTNANPTTTPSQPKATSLDTTGIGRIEFIRPEFGDSIGYLIADHMGKLEIHENPEYALTFKMVLHTDSTDKHQRIYSLKIVDGDTRFPFLGLRLFKRPMEDPDELPPTKPTNKLWEDFLGVPPRCKASQRLVRKAIFNLRSGGSDLLGPPRNYTAWAMWDFVQTTESARGPGDMRKAEGVNERDRVVSAAWTVGDTRRDGIELGLTWPEEGDRKTHAIAEMKLDAVLHKGAPAGLHAHAQGFSEGASRWLDEEALVLVFKPIPNP